ncbi:MAG: ATP-dependent DNA helicase RecQ [Verrucomicrobiota bacterium]|nr:ATP-dependent DNA helicase RecQ [Verrucomicrobiota bacterium]
MSPVDYISSPVSSLLTPVSSVLAPDGFNVAPDGFALAPEGTVLAPEPIISSGELFSQGYLSTKSTKYTIWIQDLGLCGAAVGLIFEGFMYLVVPISVICWRQTLYRFRVLVLFVVNRLRFGLCPVDIHRYRASMPENTLRTYFGFDRFRPPQDEIIRHILEHRDLLVIMPTGGGKSLCYQLPALILPGITLVISPLISLMKDQVDALLSKNIPAGFINSSQTLEEQRRQLGRMESGELKLVYVSPERFRAKGFTQTLARCEIAFVAVDEAHCLSQWGHDFRPDYLRIGKAIQELGSPPVAAFTATATPDVRGDILNSLQMRDPVEIVSGFARENLTFNVVPLDTKVDKLEHILELIKERGTGIIYCATRKSVESICEELIAHGVRKLVFYHGGMSDIDRNKAQEDFMSGRSHVAVATNAFGMGIDRSDIRFVAHYEMPGSVEAYYQEGGRAGRDGKPAVCELLFNYSDKRVQEFFLEGANPTLETIREVYRVLRKEQNNEHEIHLSIDALVEKFPEKVNPMAVSTALSFLAKQEVVDRFDIPGQRVRGTRLLHPELSPERLKLDTKNLQDKRQRDTQRLEAMVKFCFAKRCRQQWILEYFGEHDSAPCGRCDYCQSVGSPEGRDLKSEELELVRKALSGVARMSRRVDKDTFEPGYGRRKVIQCLMGSKVEGIAGTALEKLTTFGLLKDERKGFVEELFAALDNAGLVEIVDGEYPLLALTKKGVAVLFGHQKCRVEFPSRSETTEKRVKTATGGKNTLRFEPEAVGKKSKKGKAGAKGAAAKGGADNALLNKLKVKRIQLAAIRKVPVYNIFPNKVLEQLAAHRPRSIEDAMEFDGIGEVNSRKLGPFIEIIREYQG